MFTQKHLEIIKRNNIYVYKKNLKPISDNTLKKIKNLGIPPIYETLWVSKSSTDKIQAICLDSKNRKQYIYNKKHTEGQKNKKYMRMYDFMNKMPLFWNKINKESNFIPLCNSKYPKKYIMANMFKIIKLTNIRIGNKKYLDSNNSVGLTTLKKENVIKIKNNIHLKFLGKSGIYHNIKIDDKNVIFFLNRILKTPNEWLMQYQTSDKKFTRITSCMMNKYLQEIVGKEFTCKDFRTHYSNIIFLKRLKQLSIKNGTKCELKNNISEALGITAKELGHNKSTSKKSYVNNNLINMYLENPDKIKSKDTNLLLKIVYKNK